MEQSTQIFKPGTRFVESAPCWQPHIQAHIKLEGLFIYDFWQNPCYHEVLSARNYPAHLALAEVQDLRFLLFRFGELTWADVPLAVVTLPPVSLMQDVLPVYMVVICAEDGIIRASIAATIEGEFLLRLKQFVARQRRSQMPDDQLTERVSALFEDFPTPEHLLPFVVARTVVAPTKVQLSKTDVLDLDLVDSIA
jgi:hypothetical protein